MNCWHCGRAIEVIERVGFRDNCPGCDRALHACRNCRFFDPAYNNSCRETIASRVVDKERFNFCEYFAAAPPGAVSGGSVANPKPQAKEKLEALFKKKP
ncbi:MAG TPA: hypothetical protein VMU16_04520 [Candidatus Binataceae bacterium]|nr:hypothetical protein [Candidatus Binataceae bacterium]